MTHQGNRIIVRNLAAGIVPVRAGLLSPVLFVFVVYPTPALLFRQGLVSGFSDEFLELAYRDFIFANEKGSGYLYIVRWAFGLKHRFRNIPLALNATRLCRCAPH